MRPAAAASVDGMDAWERAVAHVAARATGPALPADARLVVHFHPDRRHTDARGTARVVERLAEGYYLSQFATGVSAGGLTARTGGDRWRWESRIFGGAYDEAAPEERPVCGAVEHRGRGGALRFGSSWLALRPATWDRATLCWPDSAFRPVAFGTPALAGDLLARADAAAADPLDDDVEAHLHGGLDIGRDVAALVLDPSYRDTRVEAAARALPVALAWSEGRVLEVAALDGLEPYRGPAAVELARSIARHGRLDARRIGRAAAGGGLDPQLVKQVWHLVARFGRPAP